MSTELSQSERRRLEDEAVKIQRLAALAYADVVLCLHRDKPVARRLARRFQDDAAYFSWWARECLLELIGSEPEEYAALAGFLVFLASWGFWWAATPA